MKVLIAEDNQALRELLSAIFSGAGYQTHNACDGQEALRWIEQEKFDILIADVAMPVLTGHELYERVKEIDPALASQMILITGVHDRPVQALLAQSGIPCFFKPFEVRRLLEFVEQMVHTARR